MQDSAEWVLTNFGNAWRNPIYHISSRAVKDKHDPDRDGDLTLEQVARGFVEDGWTYTGYTEVPELDSKKNPNNDAINRNLNSNWGVSIGKRELWDLYVLAYGEAPTEEWFKGMDSGTKEENEDFVNRVEDMRDVLTERVNNNNLLNLPVWKSGSKDVDRIESGYFDKDNNWQAVPMSELLPMIASGEVDWRGDE
jgi:hypothetical protein